MAKVRSITIGLGRKYKHPFETYENFDIEASVTLDLEPDEAVADAVAKAHAELRPIMIATFKEFKPKRTQK